MNPMLLLQLLGALGIPLGMAIPGIVGSYPEHEQLRMMKEERKNQVAMMGQMLSRERSKDAYDAGVRSGDKAAARQERALDRSASERMALMQLLTQSFAQPTGADAIIGSAVSGMGEMDSRRRDMESLSRMAQPTGWEQILG